MQSNINIFTSEELQLFIQTIRELSTHEQGLSYGDILLIPDEADFAPHEANTSSKVADIQMSIPVISASMDTVTESMTAIVMAIKGGFGFIHKALSIEDQADKVRKVKNFTSAIITKPVVIAKDATIEEAREIMLEKNISGIPVVDQKKYLIGIVTKKDVDAKKTSQTYVFEIMTPKAKLITGKDGTTVEKAHEILRENRIEKLPLVDEDFKLKGLITYKDIKLVADFPTACKDKNGRLIVGAAVGPHDCLERGRALVEAGIDILRVDTSHGHTHVVRDAVTALKKEFPHIPVAAGNIVTAKAAEFLIKAGADVLIVGIGPGSICTTRQMSGAGYPQFSAVKNVSRVAKKYGISVIADGGIKFSGDITKAIAAGADAVILGSLLAGTDEAPGEKIIVNGVNYKVYRGMGSVEAMKEGSRDRYSYDKKTKDEDLVPQGVSGKVPYRGPLAKVLHDLLGGLEVGMGLTGKKSISELKDHPYTLITNAGQAESQVHSIII